MVQSAHGPGIWAITQIFENLRQSSANRNNEKAIEQMVWAEMAAAISFNSAGLGIIHSMAHAMGGLYDSPHGLCNAIGMVATCKYNLSACPDRFAIMARAAGINTVGMSDMKAGEAFIDLVAELKADLGITTTFGDLGLKEKDLDGLAKFAAADICSEGNPKDVGIKEMRAVFASCM